MRCAAFIHFVVWSVTSVFSDARFHQHRPDSPAARRGVDPHHAHVRLVWGQRRVIFGLDALTGLERGGADHPAPLDGHEHQRHCSPAGYVGEPPFVAPPALVVTRELAVRAHDDAPGLLIFVSASGPDLNRIGGVRAGQRSDFGGMGGGDCLRRSCRYRVRMEDPARDHPTIVKRRLPTANTATPAPLLTWNSP